MAGVLIKEWSAFVLKEVRARKEVEREMLALREDMRSLALNVRGEINVTRQEWISDASFYGSEVRAVYEGVARQRVKVAAMAARVAARMLVTRTMRVWHSAVAAAKARRAVCALAERTTVQGRARKALATWTRHARSLVTQRWVTRRVVSHLTKRVSSSALRSWRQTVALNRRQRVVLQRAVARLHRRAILAAFEGWWGGASERRRLEVICLRMTARWQRCNLTAAVNTWFNLAHGKVQRRSRLSSLVLRVLGRQLHSAFLTWEAGVKQRRRERHLLRIVGDKVMRGSMRSAFRAWAGRSERAGAGSRARRVVELARRIAAKWGSRWLALGFERWRARTATMRGVRVKARALLWRAQWRTAVAAFTAWATLTLAVIAATDSGALFAVRMMRSNAFKALRRWREVGPDR